MQISIQKSNQLKSIAILMMLCLHLFNTDYKGLFQPLIFIGDQPLSYYISLFSDACVPIFAFVSGYGLYYSYVNKKDLYAKKNVERTKKLYTRYWIILLLFAVLLGWIMGTDGYPGSFQKFALNFTGLKGSYNGAWWFFTIYILFVFTSKFWFIVIDKVNPYLYLSFLFVIYVVAFYFRIYNANIFQNPILHWTHTQSALYFCTLFQFMLGSFALKYQWHKKVSDVFNKIKWPNLVAILGIIILIVFHGIIPNFIVAPFTALGFIFLFLQMKFGKSVDKSLDFFNPHATNLWLIHMFFYITYFKDIIFAPQYPLLIFIWLVLWCLVASVIVNFIYNRIYSIIK
ncbi:acyltransferase family protein [Aequorivita sediminis]|uniref:acyltransferase family protein n=1 Tax=Aequorivita sediminis TaxID=3073653 RepID=UPI0028B0D99B|nr:acyltransferase [Aequorivita sp. F6058]